MVAAHAKDAATLELLQDQVGALQQKLQHAVAVNRRLSTQLGTEPVDPDSMDEDSPVAEAKSNGDAAPQTPLPEVSVRRLATGKLAHPGNALNRVRDALASPADSVSSADGSPSSEPMPRVTIELSGE